MTDLLSSQSVADRPGSVTFFARDELAPAVLSSELRVFLKHRRKPLNLPERLRNLTPDSL